MAARLQLAAASVLALVAVILAGVLVLGRHHDSGDKENTSGFFGAVDPPGARAGQFSLTDQDGKPVSLREYHGRTVVVTFLYSHCEDTCPVVAQQIRGALDQLGHDVPVLAISVDPRNDTRESVNSFDVRQHVVGRMRWVLGSKAQLAPVWKAYGVQPQLSDAPNANPLEDHTDRTVIVDGRDMQRVGYFASDLTPEDLAHDLRKLKA